MLVPRNVSARLKHGHLRMAEALQNRTRRRQATNTRPTRGINRIHTRHVRQKRRRSRTIGEHRQKGHVHTVNNGVSVAIHGLRIRRGLIGLILSILSTVLIQITGSRAHELLTGSHQTYKRNVNDNGRTRLILPNTVLRTNTLSRRRNNRNSGSHPRRRRPRPTGVTHAITSVLRRTRQTSSPSHRGTGFSQLSTLGCAY